MADNRQVPETGTSPLPGDPPESLDPSEDEDYFRHLGKRLAMPRLKFKFSLGTLMFIMACLGVVFAPLQFLGFADLPIVFGLAVMFMAILIVLAIVITPRSSEK